MTAGRPCGCEAAVAVFGHTKCELAPPPPAGGHMVMIDGEPVLRTVRRLGAGQ